MKKFVAVLAAAASLTVTAISPSRAEPVTYFLHHKGGCVNDAAPGPFMDLKNSLGDDDGCGTIGPSGLTGGEAERWKATVGAPVAFGAKTKVKATVYVTVDHPTQLSVSGTLLAGAEGTEKTVGSGESAAAVTTGPVDGYLPYVVEFETTEPIAAGDILTFAVVVNGSLTRYFGYEGGQTSKIEFGS